MSALGVIAAVVIGLALIYGIVGLFKTDHGPGGSQKVRTQSFCSYATHANGSRLISLAQDPTVGRTAARYIVQNYGDGAPNIIKPSAIRLRSDVLRMIDTKASVPNAQALADARVVDEWVASRCTSTITTPTGGTQ
jgi:hypothetical protein